MPALTDQEKALLGPIISPFERSGKEAERRVLKDGETNRDEFEEYIHDGIENRKPKHGYVELTNVEIEIHLRKFGRYQEKCFLWVIDETSIKMIRERTRNVLRALDPEHVCHTNLTAAGKAFLGGELFFGEDGKLYINYFSDRYGHPTSDVQWQTVLSYLKRVGYTDVVDILELLADEKTE